MIDKWFKEDINTVLKEKIRLVIIAEDNNAEFLRELLPSKYKIFQPKDEVEELKTKYEIEKDYKEKKVIIYTHISREKLKFIREYCETCGCIEIKYLHNYVKEKVYSKLGLNLPLKPDETVTAAKISIGKDSGYWIDIVQKGSNSIFDIDNEILPFLDDPERYCKKLDKQVKKEFFARINEWLGRENIEQPPATLAKETAANILYSLFSNKDNNKFKDIYKKWADSRKFGESLIHYIAETRIPHEINVWDIDVSHPFLDIDKKWMFDIAKNITNKEYLKDKLNIIRRRARDTTGKKLSHTLWFDVFTILEFEASQINALTTFDQILNFYVDHFYKFDSAVRRIYVDFLNEMNVLQPFQEYYNDILNQFLDKWYSNFIHYEQNQIGLLAEIITENREKCAIIVGDGISFELSRIIADKLGRNYCIDNGYRLADFPSTTANNMSRIYVDSGELITEKRQREEYLQEKINDNITFISLEEVNYSTADAKYLICSYKDIDSIAEKMQQDALKFFSEMESELAEKIEHLIKYGYKKVYLTSDHGFVLTGLLSESDKVEVDLKGEVDKSERHIKTVEQQVVSDRFIEIKRNYQKYNYLYFHKSNNPFKTSGTYGYAHGGISPQELVVPFLCVKHKSAEVSFLDIKIGNKDELIEVVGEMFEIVLKAGKGKDLFSQERKVVIYFIEKGKTVNKSDIITLKSDETVKKEYGFDSKSKIEAVVIDAETKESIDKATIKQKLLRDTGGLF